jgi:aminodeoxyfutalosine synthase
MTVSGPLRQPAGDRRLTDDEIDRLLDTHDIISLGMMADEARRRRHGLTTTFVRVVDVTVDTARHATVAGEVRLLGAPASRAEATSRVRAAVEWAGGVPVSGFSLADLEGLAAVEQVTLRSLLEDLHANGLELVAEAPIDRLHDPRRSIEEVNIAGLALARLTVQQAPLSSGALLRKVAELQRAVGVIRAFAPLPRALNPAMPTTGFEDIKCVALARLVVDNVPSIQVDWALYGPKLAQVALTVGADDVDGVSAEIETTGGPRRGPLEEIRRSIRACGQEPLERNGRFEPVAR